MQEKEEHEGVLSVTRKQQKGQQRHVDVFLWCKLLYGCNQSLIFELIWFDVVWIICWKCVLFSSPLLCHVIIFIVQRCNHFLLPVLSTHITPNGHFVCGVFGMIFEFFFSRFGLLLNMEMKWCGVLQDQWHVFINFAIHCHTKKKKRFFLWSDKTKQKCYKNGFGYCWSLCVCLCADWFYEAL